MDLIVDDEAVAPWVASQLGLTGFGPSKSIGIADGNTPICGVVYHNFGLCMETGAPLSIEASIASTSPRWATRAVLHALFAYPFKQLGVKRMSTRCCLDDERVIEFNKRLGFRAEGIMKFGWSVTKHAAHFRMLRNECRWIRS